MQHDNKQREIETIRFKLWSIHKLHPRDIYHSLLQLITLQQTDEFVPMMRECIRASKHDPHLGRYIALFDQLLNHPTFNHLLHSCLVQFYSTIVKYLSMQQLWSEIEQAMIVRKYWVRRIHYRMYDDLRTQTYRLTCIDVDNVVSGEAIENIRYYYAHVLRLTQQETFYYLPQLHQLNPAYYHSYNPITPLLPKINDSNHPNQPKINETLPRLLGVADGGSSHRQTISGAGCMQQSNPINSITNPTNVQNNCYYQLSRGDSTRFAKRTRCESEETNAGEHRDTLRKCTSNNQQLQFHHYSKPDHKNKGGTEVKQLSPVPQKQQPSPVKPPKEQAQQEQSQSKQPRERTKAEVQAVQMIHQLRSLNQHECRECGMSFVTEEYKQQHSQQHIKDKLRKLDIADAKKYGSVTGKDSNRFKSVTTWTNLAADEEDMSYHIVQTHHYPQIRVDPSTALEGSEQTSTQDIAETYKIAKASEQTRIEEPPAPHRQHYRCPLCCLTLHQTVLKQQWIYRDAIRVVLIDGTSNPPPPQTLMHIRCCHILRQIEHTPSRWTISAH